MPNDGFCVSPAPPMDVRPEHVAILAKMLPYPAAVQTDCYDIVASNRAYRFLFDDLDAHPFEERNCAWQMFTNPTWRDSLLEEGAVYRDIVARLRGREAEHRDDPRWTDLMEGLRAGSAEFVRLWDTYDIARDHTKERRYRSPRAGILDVHFQSLWLDRRRGERIIVMTPLNEETEERMRALDALVGAAPECTGRYGPSESDSAAS